MFYDRARSLGRFGYSLILVLGVRMCHNVAKGPRSISVIVSRVTSLLLRALVPKRNGGHGIAHG